MDLTARSRALAATRRPASMHPRERMVIDPNPRLRTLSAHTGADFEGQLLNRQRGEQLEGVEVVDAREAEPQRHAEQPGPRPVPAAPASGAAQEQAPLPPDPEPVPDQEPGQEPAAAPLVVAAPSDEVSKPRAKKAWKQQLQVSMGKPPFDYKFGDTTIQLQVHADGRLSCAVPGCAKPEFGSSAHTRGEKNAQKHAELHAKSRKVAAAADLGRRRRAASAGAPPPPSLSQTFIAPSRASVTPAAGSATPEAPVEDTLPWDQTFNAPGEMPTDDMPTGAPEVAPTTVRLLPAPHGDFSLPSLTLPAPMLAQTPTPNPMGARSTVPFMFKRLPGGLADRLALEATEAAKRAAAQVRQALAPRPAPERLERLPPSAPPFDWLGKLCSNLAPRLASRLLASKRVDSLGTSRCWLRPP